MNPQAVQFLVVRIRRARVLEDALNQIAARADELKKPLRIIFSSGTDPFTSYLCLFAVGTMDADSALFHARKGHCRG